MCNAAKPFSFCIVIQTFLFVGLTHESISDSLAHMSDLEIYRLIGSRIAARRKELRLKQAEVAAQIGLTRASLANIEKGRQKVMLHQIYRIAEALRIETILDLVPRRFSTDLSDQPVKFAVHDMREDLKAQAEQFVRRTPVRR
jgi:transcriptional regulator with XRE-family HTH domain